MKTSIAALAVLLCATAGARAPNAHAPDPESKLGSVREKILAIQKALQNNTTERDSLAARLRDAELDVAGSRGKLEDIKTQRKASERRRAELNAQRDAIEKNLSAERGALAGQLRAAYAIGRQEQLKLLLNQQDPAQLGRMFVYYGYFGRQRAEKIDAIRIELARLAELERQLSSADQALLELEQAAASEFNQLKRARTERNRALASLDQQIKGGRTQLMKLQREAAALEKLLEELRKATRDLPITGDGPFEKAKGKLKWPVDGRLVAKFGTQRTAGLRWNGVLIAAGRGSPVRAVYFGRVVYADWLSGMGLLTIIEHSGGYLSLYGYNEQLHKAVGDRVKPGELIASTGDSGGRDKPEAYFEIRKGSKPIDPQPWIRK